MNNKLLKRKQNNIKKVTISPDTETRGSGFGEKSLWSVVYSLWSNL